MSDKWLRMTAASLGRGVAEGEIDPVALAEAHLDAIDAHPDGGRIYARTTRERATEEAAAARDRAKSSRLLGPLDGVPASWKDLFDTAGIATEAGSALLAGRVPRRDARVLRTATAAGLVCLGKTHMSELAFSGIGLNPVTATPPCVNDEEAAPGGSSSGAAASVAFGLAPLAIGSDTGGSVRVPSAWNDLVGLKTTHGRLSLEGALPLAESFDTIGPLCRSVEDAALALAALEGGAAPDLAGATIEGARLLVVDTVAMEDLRPEPAAGFDSALGRLQAAGANVTRSALPFVAEAHALSPTLFAAEGYAIWEAEIEAAPEKMFVEILNRFRGGRDVSARDYIRAWRDLRRYRAMWAEATAGYDAAIMPTTPNLPPKADRLLSDNDYYVAENLLTLRNTRIGNLMGLCGITLPTGVPSTGIMLLGAPGAEERLLRLGAAAEAALL